MVRHTRESGPKSRSGQAEKKPQRTERIAKRLARAGVASRREVERLIGLGLVAVNGRILATPAVLVSRDDVVTVEGKVIGAPEPTRVWRYHKPAGLLTTNRDPKDRATVFEHLPADLPRVVTVGRLDLNSEGLLLLTNDGGLARALELPANAWRRVYRARALGRVTQAKLDTLKDGIVVEGVHYGAIDATLDKAKEKDDGRANVWLTVALNEGKNREVRRVLEAIGLKVNRLLRLAYGPFQLGTLAPGEVEEVGPRVIREQLAEFIAGENLPSGARTATPATSAGRRPGTALADPRRKPSRVRADEAKAALERETAPKRERTPRDGPSKAFGAKPKREGFGDRKTSSYGGKKPRSEGAYGARKSSHAEERRPRTERSTGARKASFGDKPARKSAGYGDKPARKSAGYGDKPVRKSAGYGDKASSFGEGKPRGERAYGDRARKGGDDRPRGPARGKPGARAGEDRPYKRRDDSRSAPRSGGRFGEGDKRPSKAFGERSERPAGKPFGKPGGFKKTGGRPGGFKKTDGKPVGFKKTGGFKKAGGKPFGGKPFGDKPSGGKPRAYSKPAGEGRSGPARGPKPAGRGRPGPAGAKPRGPRAGGPKVGGPKPRGPRR